MQHIRSYKLKLKQASDWPYADSSTGVFRGLLRQKYPCWVAMGPARDLFTGEIADTIRGFLRNSLQESNSFVTFTLFMVGKVPQKTKPTIMVVSDDKPRRKEAYDKIKESKILANYPGFEIGHCSVAAEHEDLCQLGTEDDEPGHTGPYSEQNDHQRDPWQNSIALSSEFPPPQGNEPFRIYFRASVHGTSPSATCGGAFFRNGRLYLITTAHVMGLPQPPGNPDDQTFDDAQDDSDDCEITGFNDWDSDAEDQIFSSMTSSESQTSSSAGSDSEEWLLDRVPSHQLFPSTATFPKETVERTSYPSVRPPEKPADLAPSIALGPVKFIYRESDLVLVEVLGEITGLLDFVCLVKPLDPQHYQIQDFWDQNGSPITVLTTSRAITGKPSSMPLYTRLPGTRDFQKLYCFYLDKPLSPGDCGSWVVAGGEQELVGFVVAGSPKTGMCLVCPVRRAMEVFDYLLQQQFGDSRSSVAKEPGVSRTAKSAHDASDQPVHSGDSQLVHRDNGSPSHSAHLGPAQVVDDDRVQREAAEGATHTLPESSIQRPKGKQPTMPDAQLGLTGEEIQLLRYHQIQANSSSSTSRAASSASSQGQLLLDASSLAALSRHLDLLMGQIQQRIEGLSKRSSMVTMQKYDDAGNLVDTTDSDIANFHNIMGQLDELELDFDRIRHIRDIVRGFRQESDKVGLQGPDTSGSQRVPDAVTDADTQRGKGPGRAY